LNQEPPSENLIHINQEDITNLNSIENSNNSSLNSLNNISNNNNNNNITTQKMNFDEQKNSQAYLFKNENENAIDIDEEEKSMKPPRKHTVCCMCCPLWLCCSITIFIIALIGILVFVFWPKIPDVNITSVVLSESTGDKSSVRYQIPSLDNDNQGGIEIDLDIHVTVQNDNFYNLNIHSLNTRVFYQTEDGKALVGKGSSEDLSFPRHKTTEFVLPLTIGYYINDFMKDTAIFSLLKSCASQTLIKIQYEVDIGIFPVEIFYTPTYKGDQSFQCPVTDMAGGLASILSSDIYSSISQYLSQFLIRK